MDSFLRALALEEEKVKRLSGKLAPIVVGMVQQNMENPSFKANSSLTKKLKNGGAKPLFNTGETRASMTYKQKDGGFDVGTNKRHAKILNDGGKIKPIRSQKLAIPANKQVKQRVDAWGVRKTLKWLEDAGWRIIFRPRSIMGKAPHGARPFGEKVNARMNRNNKKKAQGVWYVLFFRSSSISVPKREFMTLTTEQTAQLIETAKQEFNRP
ncbi:hypothetical protein [Shewanella halifaxensis]|uniref:hypothetical protein n=1 Tax=Shewanella halifaxensis TaxID=271098 RepID=UPI000D59D8A6|nr:hypothetical protein [Shewanella halifaxensis]